MRQRCASAIGIIKRLSEVAHVVMHAGRAHLSNGNALTNKAEIDVGPTAKGSAVAERKILAAVAGAPGVRWWANTFLTERVYETWLARARLLGMPIERDLVALDKGAT